MTALASRRSSSPRLRLVKAKRRPAAQKTRKRAPKRADELTIVQQVRCCLLKKHRRAAALGAALGGVIPAFSFGFAQVAHTTRSPLALAFVAAGLAYSGPTVYGWAKAAFGAWYKALGFVLLLEGSMVAAGEVGHGLAAFGWVALFYLVGINAVAAACALALGRRRA